MRIAPILRVTGGLLMLFSVAQLVPVAVALFYNESTITPFLAAFAISFLVGGLLWIGGRGEIELRSRDGFLITVLFYLGLGFTGAVPFLLAPSVGVAFTDGVFESLSGLTTTGATVLAGLDDLPRSVLLYRQLLQWLGGMGIIVLAVAVLPMLGVGGMQLYRAESPGPVKDTKLTPRIAQTAKALWYLYLGFTVACALAYYFGGMSVFDAICYSFSTVAIGGFAPHDASVGYFDSVAIESVAIVFMVLSGMSFALHFTVLARRSFAPYARDNELRLYVCALGTVAAIVIVVLLLDGMAPSQSIREGLFQAVSIATTTGFATTDHSAWPMLAPVLMIFAAFAGGCAGSTAGGLKMYRVLLIYRQGIREIRRLIHPNGIFHIKLGEQLVPDRVVDAVWGFFAVYLIVFVTMVCILLGVSDLDFLTAFSAVAANLNNLGPGLGDVAANYQALPPATKWVLMLAMVLGRLEIFTLLVVLTPQYWRS
ncbi:MAG: TrkH family potassium uptake protein [Gammaproteobacteria bacterium]|nr:TrkH family potassium uptake protein [Gammaproteobacteria bacterium]